MFLIGFICGILMVAAQAGRTRTLAGTGVAGFSGDQGPAAAAQLANPYGMALGPDRALYVCEVDNHRIRRIDLAKGTISTVAGSGRRGYAGDGGPALAADLNQPYEVGFDPDGHLYFVEMQNHIVRRVDARTGLISTVAGTGAPGFSGDGGPATAAQLRQPHSIAFDRRGGLLICDIGNHRIRRLDLATGVLRTWGGTGERKPVVEGAPVAATPLNGPRAIDSDTAGNLYLALREGNAIYRIDPEGRIHHLAGTGEKGFTGDGGPAAAARFSGPKGLAWSPAGTLYVADTENHAIRRIDLKSGTISTIVGTGRAGDGPDGDGTLCQTRRPHSVTAGPGGLLYIADSEAHRVRVWQAR